MELDTLTLDAVCWRDEAACHKLVVVYQTRVFSVLSRMLHRHADRALIEDIAQETFLRVFHNIDTYEPARAKLSTWILTIATRLAIDVLRRPRMITADTGWDELEASASQPEVGRAIAHAVTTLEPEFRAVFVLSAYHGFDQNEIANALNIAVGTVKSRLSRARLSLQTLLQGES